MNATDKRRNRELAVAIETALVAAGFGCDTPDGWDDSLYASVTDDSSEWSGKLRISDHDQPAGGGFSERLGCRHGEADISIIGQSGIGGDLDFGPNGTIVNVGRVRVSYDANVPPAVRAAVDPIIADYAGKFQRRAESSARAIATRRANRKIEDDRKLKLWHDEVRCELAKAGVTDIDDGDGMPFPFVPAGTPFRSNRLSQARNQIDIVCKRLLAARVKIETLK